MKPLKTIAIALFGTFTMVACKQEKQTTEPIENNEVLSTENPIQEDQKIAFQRTLALQNISFDVISIGEGSIGQLNIETKGLENDDQKISMELDGQVVHAEIEDLNSDGFPEVLIYTVSAGSGSYGNVIGYSVNNGKSISRIYFPDIFENKEASAGYMGHDEFAIVETSLVRRFPIYKADDPNSNPTGGTRQIQYKLKDGEASRLFEIENISEY